MTQQPVGGSACVVVAAAKGEPALDLAERQVQPWVEIRPGRLVARVWCDTDTEARDLVRDLRAGGWAAVLGPPDEAHEVGWRNRNRPTVIGNRLAVCFPWAPVEASVDHVVEIDPGTGFGTGDHPSTRLVLEAVVDLVQGGESVIDVGCGSGVLAVAATVLGAARATGIDINVEGLVAAEANSRRNGLADRVEFSDTPVEQLAATSEPADLVLANIHAPILADMAEPLQILTKVGGLLVLSGLSRAQVSRLVARFELIDFDEPRQLDDWVALVGRRRR